MAEATLTHVCWTDLAEIRATMPRLLQRVLLYGWPATGKSKFGHALAEGLGIQNYPVTLNVDFDACDLTGMNLPDGKGGTVFWKAQRHALFGEGS